MNFIKQNNLLRIFERSVDMRRDWDTDVTFTLRTLMMFNDYAKKKLGIRLYGIFEIIGMSNDEDAHLLLSYTISNIEELSAKQFVLHENKGVKELSQFDKNLPLACMDPEDVDHERCKLSADGKCKGNFSPLNCDGIDTPEECEEMLDADHENDGVKDGS